MTDVQNCFASAGTPTTTPTNNVQIGLDTTMPTTPFVLRAPPSSNSKLILQNMEEVLDSVKKKHREKHKRKREQRRRAALLAEAEEAQKKSGEGHVQMEKSQPLHENSAPDNGLVAMSAIQLTPKASPLKCSTPANQEATAPTPKAKNVFEFMMSARNRSLGTNSMGQELIQTASDKMDSVELGTPKTKRKEMLQDWNERKGGAKRKLEDEARSEYIHQQLEHRSKRLKKMLTKPEEVKDVVERTLKDAQPISAPVNEVKRSRGRPRTRRLSSRDSEMQQLPVSNEQNAETSESISKLVSPTKKRDSLLGYFSKVQSPKEGTPNTTKKLSLETPKRYQRRTNTKLETSTAKVIEDEPAAEQTQTPSCRPRRSCAGKARYDYDLETSPGKGKPTAIKTKAFEANISIEVIDLDNSNQEVTPKKLAPLFVRQMPKPTLDPTVLRARQEFLHSGVPEKLKQEQQRQKQLDQLYEDSYELFPSIAHVLQLNEQEKEKVIEIKLPWALRAEETEYKEPISKRKSKANARIGSITNCTLSDFQIAQQPKPKLMAFKGRPLLENKRDIVKLWKNEFDRFPIFKCYNQMREKYRHFSAIDSAQDTQQVGESFVVTRRTRRSLEAQQQYDASNTDEVKPPATAPNGELLFSEKYKPLLFEQVLVNLLPVQQLRDFLSNWSGGSNRNTQMQDETSFDFGNESSSMGGNSNTMVLLGPCSSGKTNAVFALANDLNFNVLEINAGMKRTGKKLIQELQEATQSHQIRKDSKTAVPVSTSSSQKLLLNGLKSKRQQAESSDSCSSYQELSQSVRKSLILIEDADILFDNLDAGFTDAIYTLAASSKRPVIVIASNPNCAHLQRLMQQNTINFNAPNVLNISKFLAVLSLMENCPIELDELISLYLYNNKNLRKTLMELQFYIQSGGDRCVKKKLHSSPPKSHCLSTLDGLYVHQRLFEYYTLAQNVEQLIPFPVDFNLLRLNLADLIHTSPSLSQLEAVTTKTTKSTQNVKRKSRSPKKTWLNNATHKTNCSPLDIIANFYEHISTAALLDSRLDSSDRLQPHLTEEIAHTLVELAVASDLGVKQCAYSLFDKQHERLTLWSQLSNYQLRAASSRSLDYEPAMRAICRSEKQRASTERRSSRFYHYLRNHSVCPGNFSTDAFDAACEIFQENVVEDLKTKENS